MSLRQIGLGLLLSFGFSMPPAIAQMNPDQIEIKTIPLSDGIYMLMGDGGNIGVSVGEDGTFLVDDQFAPLSEKIKAAIAQLTDKPVKFVVNTHWHFDHTGGNENFANAGAIIVAHNNVRKRMATEQFMEAFQRKIPPSPKGALPMVTFRNGTTFHMNGQTIGVQHIQLPAHTDGDSIVYFEEANVLHTGDTYFNGSYPFIDTSSNGSLLGIITAAQQMLGFTDTETKIIPGHGPLSNKAELEVYVAMLQDVQDKVNSAIATGLTLDEFIASKPTAQYDEAWGNGFMKPIQFLTIIYQDAMKRQSKSLSSLPKIPLQTQKPSPQPIEITAVRGLY